MNADENNARWTKDRLKAILLGPVRWGTILFITVGLVVYVFLTAVADVGAVCHQELAGNPPSPTKVCASAA